MLRILLRRLLQQSLLLAISKPSIKLPEHDCANWNRYQKEDSDTPGRLIKVGHLCGNGEEACAEERCHESRGKGAYGNSTDAAHGSTVSSRLFS
jgi:hypothetical protein